MLALVPGLSLRALTGMLLTPIPMDLIVITALTTALIMVYSVVPTHLPRTVVTPLRI